MRIIQGRDYYDRGLAYGRDDAVVFVREKDHFIKDEEFVGYKSLHLDATRTLSFNIAGTHRSAFRSDDLFNVNGIEFRVGLVTVVFCGHVYHGIRIETDPDRLTSKVVYYWNRKRFEDWTAQIGVIVTKTYWWER